MHALLIALIAAGAMVASDVLGTIMVMAEASNRGWLAGIMDCAGWYVAIATTTISVSTLSGHDTAQKIYVLIFVGAANILGTKLGQVIGSRIMGHERHSVGTLHQRLEKLEQDKGGPAR